MSGKNPSKNFNPYHKWLGIPEKKCPPTFYELLGISLNEDDRAVIQSAAERQKTHVEQFLGTSYNKFANQLIAQIDEAEITLLSPELRRKYDRQVDLFKKRRKKRQFDPTVVPSSIQIKGNRTVGEGSGFAREYAGIVTVLCVAFFGMAAASFWLPWGKLQPDKQNANKSIVKPEEPIAKPKPVVKVTAPAEIPELEPEPETKKVGHVNSIGMQFEKIKPGTFMMGSEGDDVKSRPVHKVTISKPFEIGVFEVTQEQYQNVMGVNPSQFKEPKNPVENICWNDAVEFCRKLSEMLDEKSKGYMYRLPTEAEWEYACRADTTTRFNFGNEVSQLGNYAWFSSNSNRKTSPVGTKKPNSWGLYDMHGNVAELCQDWFAEYPSQVVIDQTGPESGSYRILRGGSWLHVPVNCYTASRNKSVPDYRANFFGFRVVRTSSKKAAGGGNGISATEKLKSMVVEQPTLSPINNSAEKLINSIGMKLKLIHPGKFIMGSKLRNHNEKPEHSVSVTDQFYIGTTEVTQRQYEQVMGKNKNRSGFRGSRNPVESISWEDAKKFCRRLSELPKEKEKAYSYRLPTEVEWEYACRAGSTAKYCFGDDVKKLRDYAWYGINSQKTSHVVGEKLPNDWGLYDMHGNVWEWTESSEGARRVSRGGAWGSGASGCRSAVRGRDAPTYKSAFIGFRIALTPSRSSGQ